MTATLHATSLALVGAGADVPVVTGGHRPYVNLDIAASAPCLVAVRDAVNELLGIYSSVHRGAGWKSKLSTAAYEGARRAVLGFVGARPDDVAVFTRNTTDSLNLLASALPEECEVVLFESEHHANLLPWRRRRALLLPPPGSAAEAVTALRTALQDSSTATPRLVAVTGASNVTGEIWPFAELTEVAHAYGARIVVDAAQLAPHCPIDMASVDVDWVAFSGHKLYAPFGAGVLIGRREWLSNAEPYLAGGGAVTFVTPDEVLWSGLPERQEAGSPNVVGAVALGVACRTMADADMRALHEREGDLLQRAATQLAAIPGVDIYRLWPDHDDRVGVLTFNLRGTEHALLAEALSAEYGIAVRQGCFCAHPLMLRLLGLGEACAVDLRSKLRDGMAARLPGAVRASLGVSTTADDIDALVAAVETIARTGPGWRYVRRPGDYDEFRPCPDPRPLPVCSFDLADVG